MKILISNAGSTSLKFKLYEMPEEKVLCTGKVERVGSSDDGIFSYENLLNGYSCKKEKVSVPTYTEGIDLFVSSMLDPENGVPSDISEVGAVGFKTVLAKGFEETHELTDEVMDAMREMVPVAPAHNIPYIEAITCFREMLPETRFVGAFETAFHRNIPLFRKIFALPYEWYEKYGIKRMCYHGSSHSNVAETFTKMYGTTGKTVSCHMGGSGSICAICDGESVDNSFGLSLQTGIIHSYRTGDLDPYIIRYLETKGLTEDEIFAGMEKTGGLFGISGVSSDIRYVTAAAEEGNERAKLALDAFVYSVRRYIGAYVLELGGIDNIAFTGGIGENSVLVRRELMKSLEFLGLKIDEAKNADPGKGVQVVTTDDSKIRGIIIPADEEIIVCRKTYAYLTDN